MDQSAFRALLATPGGAGSSSKPKAKFGAAPPKRTAVAGAPDAAPKPDFKPRVQNDKSKFKKKPSDDTYRDRAAERRTGGPNDFADAEKLLEDFKARAEGAEVDKSVLEDQMKYLGGDAEHSVLVKGLDMALFERMKHKQANESDQTLEEMEDELDQALLEKASGKGKAKQRTRDEMIAEMKASRGSGATVPGEAVKDEKDVKKDSRFKPIAKDGWKAVGATPAAGEKKLRKKKKVKVADPAALTSSTTPAASTSTAAPPPTTAPTPLTEPASRPLPLLQPTVDLSDDEFDIFGDAGDYKGLDTDSDDSDAEKKPKREETPAPPPPVRTAPDAGKRKYFDDEEEDVSLTTAPSAVTNLASTAAAAEAAGGEKRKREVGSDGEEQEERPMKLQPLSGSRISARELLEMDDAAAAEEKRKEKKAHFQMKAADKKEATLKAMTPAERAEYDFQVMNSYLEKKERKAKGGKTEEEDDGGPGF